jgi:hypothetical protein
MSITQKVRALESEGIKSGANRMSRIAGRSIHAEKTSSRQGEASRVFARGRTTAERLGTKQGRAAEGGRAIYDFNKKQMSAGRRKGGKPVLMAGAEEKLSDLRRTIKEALDFLDKDLARKAARVAKKLK